LWLRLFDAACAQEDVINDLINRAIAGGRDPELVPPSPKLETAWPVGSARKKALRAFLAIKVSNRYQDA
jgi:hypothetical protein